MEAPLEAAGDDEHYAALGLPSGEEGFSLSEKEIRRAYKRKAIELHPDKRPGDESANRMFQKLQSSYEVLKDDKRRKLYDDRLRAKILKQQQERAASSRRRDGLEASMTEESEGELMKTLVREYMQRKMQSVTGKKLRKTVDGEEQRLLRKIHELAKRKVARRAARYTVEGGNSRNLNP